MTDQIEKINTSSSQKINEIKSDFLKSKIYNPMDYFEFWKNIINKIDLRKDKIIENSDKQLLFSDRLEKLKDFFEKGEDFVWENKNSVIGKLNDLLQLTNIDINSFINEEDTQKVLEKIEKKLENIKEILCQLKELDPKYDFSLLEIKNEYFSLSLHGEIRDTIDDWERSIQYRYWLLAFKNFLNNKKIRLNEVEVKKVKKDFFNSNEHRWWNIGFDPSFKGDEGWRINPDFDTMKDVYYSVKQGEVAENISFLKRIILSDIEPRKDVDHNKYNELKNKWSNSDKDRLYKMSYAIEEYSHLSGITNHGDPNAKVGILRREYKKYPIKTHLKALWLTKKEWLEDFKNDLKWIIQNTDWNKYNFEEYILNDEKRIREVFNKIYGETWPNIKCIYTSEEIKEIENILKSGLLEK